MKVHVIYDDKGKVVAAGQAINQPGVELVSVTVRGLETRMIDVGGSKSATSGKGIEETLAKALASLSTSATTRDRPQRSGKRRKNSRAKQ